VVANGTYYGLNYCFDAIKKMDGLWYQKIKIAGIWVANDMFTLLTCIVLKMDIFHVRLNE